MSCLAESLQDGSAEGLSSIFTLINLTNEAGEVDEEESGSEESDSPVFKLGEDPSPLTA